MNETSLKLLRIVPVVFALLLIAIVCWFAWSPRPVVLRFSTGSELGLYHRLATELKQSFEKHDSDLKLDLITSAGSNENIERIDAGKADIALVQNDVRGGSKVRSIAGIYPEVLHLLVRTGSQITSLDNLQGRSIGIGAPGSGTEQIAKSLLEFIGISADTDKIKRLTFSQALDQLADGQLDAGFFLTGLGAPVIQEAQKRGQISLAAVAIGGNENESPYQRAQTFVSGFRVRYPHVSPTTIPMMAYNGYPKTPVPTMSVTAVLVCHEDIDDSVVEKITKTLFEQRAVLSQQNPAFTNIDEEVAQSTLQFPIDSGAEDYYRRREPGFLVENAEAMGFVLTLLLLLWSMVVWGQKFYAQNRKNRIDKYYKEITLVTEKLNEIQDIKACAVLELKLDEIRHRASVELVEEKLAADNAYLIYQNMLNGCQDALARAHSRLESKSV